MFLVLMISRVFAHHTLCQHKIDPMSRKNMLERSVINKKRRPGLTFLEGTKMIRKYSKISMFNILKTNLSSKMSNAYTTNDMIIMIYHIIIISIV